MPDPQLLGALFSHLRLLRSYDPGMSGIDELSQIQANVVDLVEQSDPMHAPGDRIRFSILLDPLASAKVRAIALFVGEGHCPCTSVRPDVDIPAGVRELGERRSDDSKRRQPLVLRTNEVTVRSIELRVSEQRFLAVQSTGIAVAEDMPFETTPRPLTRCVME
jgi:hypothetical protein